MPSEAATFLTLPSELRNQIYLYIFAEQDYQQQSSYYSNSYLPDAHFQPNNHRPLNLSSSSSSSFPTHSPLSLLQTSHQIHHEAALLAFTHTTFYLASLPNPFASILPIAKLRALRTIHLTARTTHLRALNEDWNGIPFGCPELRLEKLVITPRRPDASSTAYAEIADLSQSHTLAYIFAETLKGLRNCACVEVRNDGSFSSGGGGFKEGTWRVVYRSLVYRLWRWGGGRCGVRLEVGEGWFRCFLSATGEERTVGREVGEEVYRLADGEMPDPGTAGVVP